MVSEDGGGGGSVTGPVLMPAVGGKGERVLVGVLWEGWERGREEGGEGEREREGEKADLRCGMLGSGPLLRFLGGFRVRSGDGLLVDFRCSSVKFRES